MASKSSVKSAKKAATICIAGFAVLGGLAFLVRPKPELFSPPSFPNNFEETAFSDMLWEFYPATIVDPNWEYPDLVMQRNGDEIKIETGDPKVTPDALLSGAPTVTVRSPVFGVFDAEDSEFELPDDDRLEFLGYAVRYPKAGDPSGKVPDIRIGETLEIPPDSEQLEVRDGEGTLLPPEAVAEIPPSLLEIRTAFRNRPTIRLFFRRQQLPWLIAGEESWVVDYQTGLTVGALNELDEAQQNVDEWSTLDFDLNIWHSTDVMVAFEILAGQLEEQELKLATNEQILLGNRVRLSALMTSDGDLNAQKWSPPLLPGGGTWAAPPPHPAATSSGVPPTPPAAKAPSSPPYDYLLKATKPGSSVLLLGSNNEFLEQCFLDPGGEGEDLFFFWNQYFPGISLGSVSQRAVYFPNHQLQEGETIRVGFHPHKAQLVIFIPELRGMPNGADVENLFDVQIPRIEVQLLPTTFVGSANRWAYGENERLIHLAAAATEFDGATRGANWWNSVVLEFETDPLRKTDRLTFYDTTPREMIEFALKESNDSRLIVDSQSREIVIEQYDPMTERVSNWWKRSLSKLLGE